MTAHDKASELFALGSHALIDYLEQWKAGEVRCRASYLLDVIHAFTHIQSQASQPDKIVGHLIIQLNQQRVLWRSVDVGLTVSEFKVLNLLIEHIGDFVSYRGIYDVVHYVGFTAGHGTDGFKTNVRSLVKRMRRKFQAIDPAWDEIENYCSMGYRWNKPKLVITKLPPVNVDGLVPVPLPPTFDVQPKAPNPVVVD